MFFCDCEMVKPIWEDLIQLIVNKHDIDFSCSKFNKMFGIIGDNFLTHLFLSLKYFIFVCKFQKKKPTFIGFKAHIKFNRETEYFIAKNKGKLSAHFRKWRFDL